MYMCTYKKDNMFPARLSLFQEYKIGAKIGKISTIHHINRIKWENHDKEKSFDKM